MGVLEQLRKEADQKKLAEYQGLDQKQQAESVYSAQILPKMQQVFKYLEELIEHLNYLEVPIKIDNYSNRYPKLGPLTQKSYKISTDGYGGFADFNRLMQINITFICEGTGVFQYIVHSKAATEQEIAFLHAKRLASKTQSRSGIDVSDVVTKFVVERKVPMRVHFEVDYERSLIRVAINNHSDFSTYDEEWQAEDINEMFLDELARYLLRKDTDFIKPRMTDSSRDELQKKITEIKLEEELELEAKVRAEERLIAQEEKHGLSYKVKSFITDKIK